MKLILKTQKLVSYINMTSPALEVYAKHAQEDCCKKSMQSMHKKTAVTWKINIKI
jgi:hypothetical protein